jgi:4-aminobutyrate aminotransferase
MNAAPDVSISSFVSHMLQQRAHIATATNIAIDPPGPKSRASVAEDMNISTNGSLSRLLPLALVQGYGEFVIDVDGNTYRDHFSGATAANMGYGLNPETEGLVRDVIEQLISMQHVPYMYMSSPPPAKLAKKLFSVCPRGFDKIAFTVSGSVANDYAIKMARNFTGKRGIVAFKGSFHGNTYGAASASGFGLLTEKTGNIGEVFSIPFPKDEAAAKESLKLLTNILERERVGAMIIETIQADTGILLPHPGYFAQARRACDKHGVLIIDDEVQTGMGRTGKWFGFEHFGFTPDIITMGKGLSGGFVPMGAAITSTKIAARTRKPQLITTFLGHPVGCAASLAVLENVEKLIPVIEERGRLIASIQENIAKRCAIVKSVRGLGYLRAIELSPEHAALCAFRAMEKGEIFGIFGARNEAIRDAPPLTISVHGLGEGYSKLEETFKEIEHGEIPESTRRKVREFFTGMA